MCGSRRSAVRALFPMAAAVALVAGACEERTPAPASGGPAGSPAALGAGGPTAVPRSASVVPLAPDEPGVLVMLRGSLHRCPPPEPDGTPHYERCVPAEAPGEPSRLFVDPPRVLGALNDIIRECNKFFCPRFIGMSGGPARALEAHPDVVKACERNDEAGVEVDLPLATALMGREPDASLVTTCRPHIESLEKLRAAVRASLHTTMPRIQHCFEAVLAKEPEAIGFVKVQLNLDDQGDPTGSFAESGLGDHDVEKCVVPAIKEWRFLPIGAPARVVLRWELRPPGTPSP